MSEVTAFDHLTHVKQALGITDTYQDTVLQEHIDEACEYLVDGGVPENVVHSRKCKGIVFRGVSDLWNYGAGGTTLSPYFKERAAQLALKWGVKKE